MKFDYNGREYRIQFEYATVDKRRGMYCYIFDDPSDSATPIAVGWSACIEPQDHFVKETGRKIALKRALRNPLAPPSPPLEVGCWEHQFPAGFEERPFRTAAWAAYFGRKK